MGGTIIGSEVFLSGCRNSTPQKSLISENDIALLDEIGETILPETADSPGAKAAKIGNFMKAIVMDCYSMEEQQIFLSGLANINRLSIENYESEFPNLTASDKVTFIHGLEQEALADKSGQPHYINMIKQLTLWGYFTSEPGATQALRYNPVPGRYIGCIPYKKGDKAWAE